MRDQLASLARRSKDGDPVVGMALLELAAILKARSPLASRDAAARAITFLEPYCHAWAAALPVSRWDPSYEDELRQAYALLDGADGVRSSRVPELVELVLEGQMSRAVAACQKRPRTKAARIAARVAEIWSRRTGREEEASRIRGLTGG